jgi:transcriptional regulator with XRE-family HTH domain
MDKNPLKDFREREGLSQDDLAKLIGVTRETITRWENGSRKPDEERLPKIAKETGIQPSTLRPDLAARAVMFSESAE